MKRVRQAEVYWADLAEPRGSEPRFRHPVVVLQSNDFNESALRTVVVVLLTSALGRAGIPGNVELPRSATGLPFASVANVTQIATIDRDVLEKRTGRLDPRDLGRIFAGIDLVFGRRSA